MADLRAKVEVVAQNQKKQGNHLDVLRSKINKVANHHESFVKDTRENNLLRLCQKYMPFAKLNVEKMDEEEKRHVYPPMLEGKRNISEWNVPLQCAHMFSWEDGKPCCHGAALYRKEVVLNVCDEDDGAKPVEKVSFVKVKDDGESLGEKETKAYWLMKGGARPLAYHVVITRMFRTENPKLALAHCHAHTVCRECVLRTGQKDEYVYLSKFCQLCSKHITITRTNGSQDRLVDVCQECNIACGSRDDLTFAFRILEFLFPLNNVIIKNTSLDRNTPDTTIEFKCSATEQTYTILIEMDTDQHKGVSAKKEVDNGKRISLQNMILSKHIAVLLLLR
jgi:hypothetical protein